MEANEKKCPHCAELIKVEATRCKHCNADLKPKSSIWPWILGIPAGVLVILLVVGLNTPKDKSDARFAIDLCWESVDDPLASLDARRFARQACQKMVADFEEKYGYSPSLRHE